ncbi:MAG: adenylosuccinate lyase, partial [Clostridiaceae bacterium]|nr:adenylosuccinate lyase [Clostridiaceae bacterium]
MYDKYENVLGSRYASEEMLYLFSPEKKFRTWRKLWIALAESEMELGLPISPEQVEEMKRFADDINFDEAERAEKAVRHDVMAHVHAFGIQCPHAKPIIHLGATSCYVGDNTDILLMRDALRLVRKRLIRVIAALSAFADRYKNLPTLGFTHFQPAQPVTVGKRATLWIQDLLFDIEDLDFVMGNLKLLGCKG